LVGGVTRVARGRFPEVDGVADPDHAARVGIRFWPKDELLVEVALPAQHLQRLVRSA
jgi:hypothetical protein